MKVFICLCVLLALGQGEKRTFRGDTVYRLTPANTDEVVQLNNLIEDLELDSWKDVRFIGDTADVRVPFFRKSQFFVFLATSGMKFEVMIEDVQNLIDEQSSQQTEEKHLDGFDYNKYHDFEEIQKWIGDIAALHPDITKTQKVGTSYEGRDFYAITVSTGTGRKNFVLNCGIHAREWVTPATCLYAVDFLIEGVENGDQEILDLLNGVDFVFIPSSNPDGYVHTRKLDGDRMWRKTRTPQGVCIGVDPNRNWDSHHCGQGASTSRCSETYCGPEPFSEPCTKAQKDFVESLPNVAMYVDVHAYSQYWMIPYGYTTIAPKNYVTLMEIADDSVAAIQATHGLIFQAGSIANIIYVASGSTADYFYDVTKIPCTFATELRDRGRYGFLLPEDQIQPAAEESFAAFKVMAQAIIAGKCNSQ